MTGVPKTLPSWSIRNEGTWDRIKAGVGLAREVRIGNPQLDERFWVDGPADFLEALFASGLDDAFLALRPLQSIVHENGCLELTWHGPDESSAAYAVLARIARDVIPAAL